VDGVTFAVELGSGRGFRGGCVDRLSVLLLGIVPFEDFGGSIITTTSTAKLLLLY
jgi:hypothetical protein